MLRTAAAGVLLILAFAGSTGPGRSETQPEYPILFTEPESLAAFGLGSASIDDASQLVSLGLAIKCYENDYIMISSERAARYEKQGFTIRSLCLGLMSGVLHDPESGLRLPSYVLANGLNEDGLDYTPEKPLELPQCFRRGLPHIDCQTAFDWYSGKELDPAGKQAYRALGVVLLRDFSAAIVNPNACARYGCDQVESDGFLKTSSFFPHAALKEAGRSAGTIFRVDLGRELEAGYAYAPSSGAVTRGPGATAAVAYLKQLRRSSDLSPDDVRRLYGAKTAR